MRCDSKVDYSIGEVTERLKVHDWKSCVRLTPYRGFESLPLRQHVIASPLRAEVELSDGFVDDMIRMSIADS